ncbi:hypothetical protein BDB00DRAFT_809528 [Zychaea mexicana]|uniref:uncharacterized protein n=1 Tax=Zychaea mexicana TaxID=64656 RepID=UPI0022FEEBBB|nr:uncharacterized protein BDB00DRAFT_809528 [Zychaea mexicana]KAI9496219.1 hypothetical protein BDB00DRAFT_809528 [Zychaea mexicana]
MTSKQLEDDGFVTVEKRFKYMSIGGAGNNSKRSKNKKKNRYVFKDSIDYTLNDLEPILAQRREALGDSQFYKDLLDILEQQLIPTQPQELICYGIGSMQHSKNAQYQFILALLLRDMLKSVEKVSIYDPVMTELDKELSKSYNIDVIETNEDGKRKVSRPTLFYMPHCGRGLYSNTLSANWDKESLPNVIMIANRFDMYVGTQLERDLRRECPYLIPAVELVDCTSFPKEFDDNKVFNDLSVITFPKTSVENVKDSYWDDVPVEKVEE